MMITKKSSFFLFSCDWFSLFCFVFRIARRRSSCLPLSPRAPWKAENGTCPSSSLPNASRLLLSRFFPFLIEKNGFGLLSLSFFVARSTTNQLVGFSFFCLWSFNCIALCEMSRWIQAAAVLDAWSPTGRRRSPPTRTHSRCRHADSRLPSPPLTLIQLSCNKNDNNTTPP